MKLLRITCMILIIAALSGGCSARSNSEPGQAASVYLQNKGSDTMVNLALAWAERYQSTHPEVTIAVTGGGSGTGLASLANNTVDLANASRKIKAEKLADETTKAAGDVASAAQD